MFKAYYLPMQEYVTVYGVNDDNNGYPHFLVYLDRQWRYISAKYFSPFEED